MPDPENQRLVWFNDRFVPESEARISIFDSSLMFGDMVFEMTRSFNQVQFKLREHLERLYASARFLRIDMEISIEEMQERCLATVEANQPFFAMDDEHRLMIDVTRGLLSLYANHVDIRPGVNVLIADFPLRWTVAGMSRLFELGIDAVVPSQRTIPASLLEPKVKNRSRIHYLMANIEVGGWKGERNWALMLDTDGFIAEGTGSNFFIAKDGVLFTPEPRNILRGVSRAFVMELAADLGLQCREANLEPYDVAQADEAFMTGTPFCLLPVVSLNGLAIGEGKPGILAKQLLDAWSAKVGLDIVGQIWDWDQQAAERPGGPQGGASPYSFKRD